VNDLKLFILSMFSKKFLAFIGTAAVLVANGQWTELVGAFGVYCTAEVVDKKTEDRAITTPEPVVTVVDPPQKAQDDV
jgi:hypothetical protein